MRAVLFPCSSCSRHVRTSDAYCPFCQMTLPPGFGATAVPAARGRLDRIATLTFALTVAGCGATTDSTGSGSDGGATGDSSAAASDAGARDAATDGRVDDAGTVGAKYGAPPIVDDGGTMAEYGAPPVLDAACCPIYGLSPIGR